MDSGSDHPRPLAGCPYGIGFDGPSAPMLKNVESTQAAKKPTTIMLTKGMCRAFHVRRTASLCSGERFRIIRLQGETPPSPSLYPAIKPEGVKAITLRRAEQGRHRHKRGYEGPGKRPKAPSRSGQRERALKNESPCRADD